MQGCFLGGRFQVEASTPTSELRSLWTWACRTNVGGQVLRTWCLGHTAQVSDSPRLIFLLRSLRPRTTPCSPARRQRAVASHGASRVFWRWMSRIPPCKFSCSGEGRWAVLSFRIERGLQRVSLKRTLSPRQHSHFSLDLFKIQSTLLLPLLSGQEIRVLT